jgi:hypothetical protein
VADETREWPSTNECAKADGSQPAEPIRDSGLCAATKVRMYGCNRNLLATSREEKPRKVGGVHVRPFSWRKADDRIRVGAMALGVWSPAPRERPGAAFHERERWGAYFPVIEFTASNIAKSTIVTSRCPSAAGDATADAFASQSVMTSAEHGA